MRDHLHLYGQITHIFTISQGYVNSPDLGHNIVQRDLDHPGILKNVTSIYWWYYANQALWARSGWHVGGLSKVRMPQGMGGKTYEDQGSVTSVIFLGVQWSGSRQETSSQGKDKIPSCTSHHKKGSTYLVGIFGSGGAYPTPGNTALVHTMRAMKCLVNLKNKMASYFSSKMSLFRNRREIAIQDKQILVNHRQVQRDKGKVSSH